MGISKTQIQNEEIKRLVISAIDFQETVSWSESYLQNGQLISPNVPSNGNVVITNLKFSVLGDASLRDIIVSKIVESSTEKISFELLECNKICISTPVGIAPCYFTASIAVIVKD